jgi:antitoxin MazE
MQARIQKWGNSLALRIPKSFAAETHLEQDALVDLALEDGRLVVTPVRSGSTLAQLLERVTEENRHGEQEMGPAVGREVWD